MVKMNLKKSALQLHHTRKNKFTCNQCEHLKSLFLEASFILYLVKEKKHDLSSFLNHAYQLSVRGFEPRTT